MQMGWLKEDLFYQKFLRIKRKGGIFICAFSFSFLRDKIRV